MLCHHKVLRSDTLSYCLLQCFQTKGRRVATVSSLDALLKFDSLAHLDGDAQTVSVYRFIYITPSALSALSGLTIQLLLMVLIFR